MWVSADYFDVELDTRFILFCGTVVVLLLSVAKAQEALLPYEREEPPVAQAPSLWADPVCGSDQRASPRNTVPIEDQVHWYAISMSIRAFIICAEYRAPPRFSFSHSVDDHVKA